MTGALRLSIGRAHLVLGTVGLLFCANALALGTVLGLGANASGGATILLNESPAYLCYQAALRRDEQFGVDDCDRAIELQGLTRMDLASTFSNRGLLLGRRGDQRGAMRDHNRALKLAPELASAWINRANAHLRQRDLAAALADLDQAVALESQTRHLAYYNRALLHQKLGNLAAARSDAEQALREAPETASYAEFLDALPSSEPLIPARPPSPTP